jgi:hypothetical protein
VCQQRHKNLRPNLRRHLVFNLLRIIIQTGINILEYSKYWVNKKLIKNNFNFAIMLLVQPPCFSSAANQQRQLLNYFKEGFVIFCIFSVPTTAKKNYFTKHRNAAAH